MSEIALPRKMLGQFRTISKIINIYNVFNCKFLVVNLCDYEAAVQHDLHIGKVRNKLKHWPWTSSKNRRCGTPKARLRNGHSRIRQSLFRFHSAEDPNCEVCGVPETPVNILETIQNFNTERVTMHRDLRKVGVNNKHQDSWLVETIMLKPKR